MTFHRFSAIFHRLLDACFIPEVFFIEDAHGAMHRRPLDFLLSDALQGDAIWLVISVAKWKMFERMQRCLRVQLFVELDDFSKWVGDFTNEHFA